MASENLIQTFDSYDMTVDVSNVKLTASMMNQIKRDYNRLKNDNSANDAIIIKKLDNFRKLFNKDNSKIPDFLKDGQKVDFVKISVLKKMLCIRQMLKKIEKNLEDSFGNLDLRFDNALTFSSGSKLDIVIDDKKSNENATINIDINEVFNTPSLEVFAKLNDKVNEAAYNLLTDDKQKKISSTDLTFGNDTAKQAIDESRKKALEILTRYLENYLKISYGAEFENGNTSSIAQLTAKSIIDEIEDNESLYGKKLNVTDLDTYLENFFNKDLINKAASAFVEDFLKTFSDDEINSSRINRLYSRADELLADGATHAEAVNFKEMATHLLENDANYKLAKMSGFGESRGKDFKNLPFAQVKEICETYANSFMEAHKLKAIPITFDATGSSGEFHDNKDLSNVYININLRKIKSLPDLYMTLSHELTHAADSAINKLNGKYNDLGGGLLNDISEDISGVDKNSSEGQIIKKLQSYCYLINPNERRARINELSALMFVDNVNSKEGNSPAMSSEIARRKSKFANYQNRVIKATQEVDNYIKQFLTSDGQVKLPAGISETSRAGELIIERVNYLKNLIENKELNILSTEEERNSLAILGFPTDNGGAKEALVQIRNKEIERKQQSEALDRQMQ